MTAFPYYFTWHRQPTDRVFPVQRAENDEFILDDGRRVYDFISTSFQASFGHSNQVIGESIRRQLEQMPVASPKATFALKERVSQRLGEHLGQTGGKLFYTVSGAESVENALKMARQVTGRTKILARQKSYHGATLGALSVTGDWRNEPHFTIDDQTVRIPEPDDDPDLNETRRIITRHGQQNIAAVILETVSGTNGVVLPRQEWFDNIQELCREFDILLIADEVLCGFGRTGPDFAFQWYRLRPDLVCTAKGITGGYVPFGAVWSGPRIVTYYDDAPLACGLTNYAHPLGLSALEGVLQLLSDERFQQNKAELEAVFMQGMQDLASFPLVREVRCRGLLAAIDLANRLAPSWDTFMRHGLHVYSNQNTVILAPPFISKPARLRAALDVLRGVLEKSTGN